jgi:MAF protein
MARASGMLKRLDWTTPASLLLASASPRRSELLTLTGWPFEAFATDVDEQPLPGERATEQALRLAQEKARAAERLAEDGRLVIGADTVVVLGERILGKPSGGDEARRMLRELRDRSHRVVTGVALLSIGNRLEWERCVSTVRMRRYSEADIERYLASGSPLDKAGAYGIQDADHAMVDHTAFTGCLANVMGLPLCHLVRAARRMGWEPPQDVASACQRHLGYDCPVYKEILN